MSKQVGYPGEDVTHFLPRCNICGEKSPDSFAVAELAERWLVAHTSAWHPEKLEALSARLVHHGMRIKRTKPKREAAP